jgi:mono/diheme cytochrome c family protein
LKAFIVGIVLGIAIVPLAVYFYLTSGRAPVATADPPLPFEKQLANSALHVRVDREMPKSVPIPANEETFRAGARVYGEHCAICHASPGMEQGPIAKGMFPKPPHLFRGKGVTDDQPGETYWKVANGIRLTGMPAFSQTLSTTQMWQITLMLANADKLSDSVKQELKPPGASAPVAPQRTNHK